MKLLSYEEKGQAVPAVLNADGTMAAPFKSFECLQNCVDLMQFIRSHTSQQVEALNVYAKGKNTETVAAYPLTDLKILSPIERPIHDILCIGVNYREHRVECAREMPLDPSVKAVYFSKRTCRILGPAAKIPAHSSLDSALDYEVELAVILGRTGKDIPLDEAESYIWGYSIFNDVSARSLQKTHNQWLRGKSLDGFSVMGPWIVTADDMAFPAHLESRVNGEVRQSASTDQMIRNVSRLISEISQGMTLEAGDILITGTPSGVGMGFNPPRYLKAGDTVDCSICGIGELHNTITD